MTLDLDTPAIADADTKRPGVQMLGDLWAVYMSDGMTLILELSAELAERAAVAAAITSGKGYPPKVLRVELAPDETVAAWIEATANLLGIPPGPIPLEDLDEAARVLEPRRYAYYRALTERAPTEATTVRIPERPPLAIPAKYNVDFARIRYMLRNFAWILGWCVIALWLPIVRAVWFYWFGPSFSEVWASRDVFIMGNVMLGGVSFLWALAWFIGTYDSLFARFNMWPDHGADWSRDPR